MMARRFSIVPGPRIVALARSRQGAAPKAPERKIPRSIYEGARDVARALVDTEAF